MIGNNSIDLLSLLVEGLDKDLLINLIIRIYHHKVSKWHKELLLEDYCMKVQDSSESCPGGCSEFRCSSNKLTILDKLLVDTGFKIFLIILEIEDKFDDGDKRIMGFQYQNTMAKPVYTVVKKSPLLVGLLNCASVAQGGPSGRISSTPYQPDPDAELELQTASGILRRDTFDTGNLDRKISMERRPSLSKRNIASEAEQQKIRDLYFKRTSFFKMMTSERDEGSLEYNLKKNSSANLSEKTLALHISKAIQCSSLREEEMDLLLRYLDHHKKSLFNKARDFFSSYVASVEILHTGKLNKVHFQIPYLCRYLTKDIKESIIWKTTRSSDQERLQMFFSQIQQFELKMKRRQMLSNYKFLYFLVRSWMAIPLLNFALVFIVNVLLIAGLQYEHDVTTSDAGNRNFEVRLTKNRPTLVLNSEFQFALLGVSLIQLGVCLINMLIAGYETLPDIYYDYLQSKVLIKHGGQDFSGGMKLKTKLESRRNKIIDLHDDRKIDDEIPLRQLVYYIVRSPYNIYNFILLVLSILSASMIYVASAILPLVMLVGYSTVLQQYVCKGPSRDWRIIIIVAALMITAIFFFTLIGFQNFPSIFDIGLVDDNFRSECTTLFNCFVTVLDNGIRYRGGILDIIGAVASDNKYYWEIWFFGMGFYAIIHVLLRNIFSATLMNSVTETRLSKETLVNEVETRCFICGLSKDEINLHGEGWYEHIYANHNAYSYLFFLIYLSKKDVGDCSLVEKTVKDLSQLKDISFFPLGRSIRLEANSSKQVHDY